jgi:uncharacterized protein DUF6600
MKTLVRLLLIAGLVPLTACNQKSGPDQSQSNDQEIERRVQERLADQRRAEQDRNLQEREQTLSDREKELERKRAQADARPAEPQREYGGAVRTAEPVGEQQSYDLFYRKLEPYGEWIETDRYGYVWRPRSEQSDSRWRPYADGHWVDTDYGWTWVSEEPFGWATYHYGRWARLAGIGWVWVPGEEWAPAWVSWRYGDDYVGWAALPPEARFDRGSGFNESVETQYNIGSVNYVFVNVANFTAPRVREVVVDPAQNITIINKTKNITNITYNNTVIVNRGPHVDAISARSQHPVQRLKIQRTSTVQASGTATVRGGVLEVPAPVVKKAAVPAPPPRVTQRVTGVQVDHTGAAMPPEQFRDLKAAQHDAEEAAKKAQHQQEEAAKKDEHQKEEAERKAREMAGQQQKFELDQQKHADEEARKAGQQKLEGERKMRDMAAQRQAEAERQARELADKQQQFQLEQQRKAGEDAMKAQHAIDEEQKRKAQMEAEAARHQGDAAKHQAEEERKRLEAQQKGQEGMDQHQRKQQGGDHRGRPGQPTPTPTPVPGRQ